MHGSAGCTRARTRMGCTLEHAVHVLALRRSLRHLVLDQRRPQPPLEGVGVVRLLLGLHRPQLPNRHARQPTSHVLLQERYLAPIAALLAEAEASKGFEQGEARFSFEQL